ncbi:MAG: intradiol ring-cleavage dioxygenase [bacterium]
MKRVLAKGTPTGRDLTRREMLGLIGAGAAALASGTYVRSAGGEPADTSVQTPTAIAAAIPSCVVRPQQTEGPYFVDEKLSRRDIRTDPSDGSAKSGVPLRLTFRVSRIDRTVCVPLAGAIVDVWQCDALGVYSDVRDMNGLFDTRGKKFLRGHQVTNANGIAEFITVYPGWYQGRAVHIHFKIRTDPASQRGYEFTSQLYFEESTTDDVHAQAPYSTKGRRSTTNATDGIFRSGGSQLMLQLVKDGQGYAGAFDIALQLP